VGLSVLAIRDGKLSMQDNELVSSDVAGSTGGHGNCHVVEFTRKAHADLVMP
jgi:hypothetical protein